MKASLNQAALPYFSSHGVTVYHGDCQKLLRDLSDESVDLVSLIHRTWSAIAGGGAATGCQSRAITTKVGFFRRSPRFIEC